MPGWHQARSEVRSPASRAAVRGLEAPDEVRGPLWVKRRRCASGQLAVGSQGRSQRLSEKVDGEASSESGPDGEDSRRGRRDRRGVLGGGIQLRRSCFMQLPWSAKNGYHQNPPQKNAWITGIDLTHPHHQVENATAPLRLCARTLRMGMGGRPGKRLPFRTTSSQTVSIWFLLVGVGTAWP